MHVSTNNTDPNRLIGELCIGGDWACAHGDLGALRYVAQCLADHTSGALHRDLIALSDACYDEPDLAAAAWVQLKDRVRVARSLGKRSLLGRRLARAHTTSQPQVPPNRGATWQR